MGNRSGRLAKRAALELQAEVDELQAKLQAMSDEVECQRADFQTKSDELQAKLQAKSDEVECQRADFQTKSDELQAKADELQTKFFDEFEYQRADFQTKSDELQAKADELQTKSDEFECLRADLSYELQAKSNELRTKADELRVKSDDLQAKSDAVQTKSNADTADAMFVYGFAKCAQTRLEQMGKTVIRLKEQLVLKDSKHYIVASQCGVCEGKCRVCKVYGRCACAPRDRCRACEGTNKAG